MTVGELKLLLEQVSDRAELLLAIGDDYARLQWIDPQVYDGGEYGCVFLVAGDFCEAGTAWEPTDREDLCDG